MADTKLTALSAMTTPTDDDLIYTVNDPAGTPASNKLTMANLKTFVQAGLASSAPNVAFPTVSAVSTQGIQLTAHATANTKGSWVPLVASTAFATETLIVTLHELVATSATITTMLLDIGIGAASSETVLIPNLLVGYTLTNASGITGSVGQTFIIPIAVAAGTRISGRIQGAVTVDTLTVSIQYRASGFSKPPGVACTALGVNDSGASTAITPTVVGSVNTKGAWTEIIAVTAAAYRYLLVAMQPTSASTASANDGLVDIGVGAVDAEAVIIPDIPYILTANEQFAYRGAELAYTIGVAVGSRIACRYQSTSTNTAARPVIAVYGIT